MPKVLRNDRVTCAGRSPQWVERHRQIGNGVRTGQRYELELGLPVRRPAVKPTGSVIAVKSDLDA